MHRFGFLISRQAVSRLLFVCLAVLLISACAAGGLGDILGGGQEEGTRYAETIEATVENVDPRGSAILVTVDQAQPIAAGQRANLYYDEGTTVSYQGRDYRPDQLERGDRIRAQVLEDGRALQVQSIVVTEDSSSDDSEYVRDDVISGNVRDIDERENTLTIDTYGSKADAVVSYDSRTRVLLGDRRLEVDDLRIGDDVDIELDASARSDLAHTITVIEGNERDTVSLPQIRGDVVSVDERRRELVVSTRDPLSSGFDVSRDDTVTFRYDTDLRVEYEGQFYTPENLERGDGVAVAYERIGDELWAQKVTVTANVRNR